MYLILTLSLEHPASYHGPESQVPFFIFHMKVCSPSVMVIGKIWIWMPHHQLYSIPIWKNCPSKASWCSTIGESTILQC